MRSAEPKVVGSSLEVDIEITSSDNEKLQLLQKYSKLLGDLYIVSHVYTSACDRDVLNEYSQDDYSVKVYKANGEKCARCWKYRNLNTDGICLDCVNAIKE